MFEFRLMTKLQYCIIFTILFLTVVVISLSSFYLYKFSKPLSSPKPNSTKQMQALKTLKSNQSCIESKPLNLDLMNARNSTLTQLNKYNQLCGSQITDHVMIFNGIPSKLSEVKDSVISLHNQIDELVKYNLTPIIVLEPVFDTKNISFSELASNSYNLIWSEYFSELYRLNPALQAEWIFMPEINTPIWDQSNFKASDFGLIVNQFGASLKKFFPNNNLDLLFNSTSYNWNDKQWQKPLTQNFNQYLLKIDKKLINRLWIQGFPFASRKSESANKNQELNIQLKSYLNTTFLMESANYLNIKKVGINTGTFSEKYRSIKDQIKLTNLNRQSLHDQTIQEIQNLKNVGYDTAVNLFLENKMQTPEETNWSYLGNLESKELFRQLVFKLDQSKVLLSIFDN